jgi:hypothetical protein
MVVGEWIHPSHGRLDLYPLTVERARGKTFNRRLNGLGQRRPPDDRDGGFGNRWREIAGIDATLDADAIAHVDALLDTVHEDENAFLGVLHEQERPTRIEESDNPGNADMSSYGGGVNPPDLGNPADRVV